LHEAQDGSARVLDACIEYHLDSVLMDNRKAHGHVSVMDRWSYAQFMVAKIFDYIFAGKFVNVKLAYLGDELLDPNRFAQLVATNRGINVIGTADIDEAFGWLGVPRPNELK
jgi:hypothetical protein